MDVDISRLSLRALDYSTRPVRFAFGLVWRYVRDDPPPPTAPVPTDTAPQTRPAEPPERPSEKAARRAMRHEPTKGQAAAIRQQRRAEEWGEPTLQ